MGVVQLEEGHEGQEGLAAAAEGVDEEDVGRFAGAEAALVDAGGGGWGGHCGGGD